MGRTTHLAAALSLAAGIGALASCSNTLPEPASPAAAGSTASAPVIASPAAVNPSRIDAIAQPHARWSAAAWSDLPDWNADRSAEFVPAFLRSCEHPAPGWAAACGAARRDGLGTRTTDDASTRAWLVSNLQPWRVEAPAGGSVGLVTGYFEPLVDASRSSRPGFRVALYAPPPDMATRKPYWTRQQIDTLPAARKSVHGSEIAWLRDPLDALLLQVQGSGRLRFIDAQGRPQKALVRVAYAAQNDQPYKSVGRWLVEQGQLTLEQASWPAIRAWARQNPKRVDEMLWSNPRFVFFREEPLLDPAIGPKGAQGVPLTPGRSIAVDPLSVPFGTPVWLDTTAPLSSAPLRRLVMAQDTGSAITGAVRADYFWGWGEDAENQAGRMKQALRMWVLWPR
jgi:membrane-bound lytic murein transglycosylase A